MCYFILESYEDFPDLVIDVSLSQVSLITYAGCCPQTCSYVLTSGSHSLRPNSSKSTCISPTIR